METLQVEISSTELIKPNKPTPSHLRNVTFSLLDQKHVPVLVPTLLFYSSPSAATPRLDITTRLKACLSETLSSFYPLAGRYETWGTTLCNDEGVPFTEARVNSSLSNVLSSLSSSSNIDLRMFYPPNKESSLISLGVHVAIQINVFTCGGFALGWYHAHKVTDGTSAVTFLKHWAALVTQRYKDAAQMLLLPDFNVGAIVYPFVPEDDQPALKSGVTTTQQQETQILSPNNKTRVVVRSFLFTSLAVARLQAESASEELPAPSRFTALAGFIWKQLLLTSPESNKAGRSILNIAVDVRSRSDPLLPKGSIGSLVESAFVQGDKRAKLWELVSEIHRSVRNVKDTVAEYRGEKRGEAIEKHSQNSDNAAMVYEWKDVYRLTAWCKSAGFSDVDFGFGNPDRIVPIDDTEWVLTVGDKLPFVKKGLVILTDFDEDCDEGNNNGVGFEAWLFLDEEHFRSLESSNDFLSFASPRF